MSHKKFIMLMMIIIIYLLFQKYYLKKIKKAIVNNLDFFYIKYINDCKSLKRYNNVTKIKNKYPLLSICISVYNSQLYIEKAILSIINQSFQDFEIIVVNDYSVDNTFNILANLQKEDIYLI